MRRRPGTSLDSGFYEPAFNSDDLKLTAVGYQAPGESGGAPSRSPKFGQWRRGAPSARVLCLTSLSIGAWSERTRIEVAAKRVHARARHAIKIGSASGILLAAATALILKGLEPKLTGNVDQGT